MFCLQSGGIWEPEPVRWVMNSWTWDALEVLDMVDTVLAALNSPLLSSSSDLGDSTVVAGWGGGGGREVSSQKAENISR